MAQAANHVVAVPPRHCTEQSAPAGFYIAAMKSAQLGTSPHGLHETSRMLLYSGHLGHVEEIYALFPQFHDILNLRPEVVRGAYTLPEGAYVVYAFLTAFSLSMPLLSYSSKILPFQLSCGIGT